MNQRPRGFDRFPVAQTPVQTSPDGMGGLADVLMQLGKAYAASQNAGSSPGALGTQYANSQAPGVGYGLGQNLTSQGQLPTLGQIALMNRR